MRRIFILFSILFGITGAQATLAQDAAAPARSIISPLKEGLPLPWPFPWAEKCPIDWSAIQGRYTMMESESREEMEISMIVRMPFGQRLVHVSTFLNDGSIHSTGLVSVNESERSLSVKLVSSNPLEVQVQATLQMHFNSEYGLCEQSQLVPILTLKADSTSRVDQARYRLIKHIPRSKGLQP